MLTVYVALHGGLMPSTVVAERAEYDLVMHRLPMGLEGTPGQAVRRTHLALVEGVVLLNDPDEIDHLVLGL